MISPIRLSILYSTLFVVSIGSGLLYLVYSVAFSSQDIVQLGDVPPPTVRSIQPRPADLPLEHFLPQQPLDLSRAGYDQSIPPTVRSIVAVRDLFQRIHDLSRHCNLL